MVLVICMAEFCLEYWSRINGIHLTERDVILPKDLDLCEGCGAYKHVIVIYREGKLGYDLNCWIKKIRRKM